MPWWVYAIIGGYAVGFMVTLCLNLAMGPITAPLAILRAVVWPLWIITGMPEGQRLPMD